MFFIKSYAYVIIQIKILIELYGISSYWKSIVYINNCVNIDESSCLI